MKKILNFIGFLGSTCLAVFLFSLPLRAEYVLEDDVAIKAACHALLTDNGDYDYPYDPKSCYEYSYIVEHQVTAPETGLVIGMDVLIVRSQDQCTLALSRNVENPNKWDAEVLFCKML